MMADVMDCDIIVSKFKLQSFLCLYFWPNTLGEIFEPVYPSKLWLKEYFISSIQNTFGILTHEG